MLGKAHIKSNTNLILLSPTVKIHNKKIYSEPKVYRISFISPLNSKEQLPTKLIMWNHPRWKRSQFQNMYIQGLKYLLMVVLAIRTIFLGITYSLRNLLKMLLSMSLLRSNLKKQLLIMSNIKHISL